MGDDGGGAAASRRLRAVEAHLTAAAPARAPAAAAPELPAAASIPLSDDDMRALRRRYNDERDKRLHLRPEGNAQYERIADLAQRDARFAGMMRDPYPQVETPHPLRDEVEVCVVGAGYGGLCAGARLVEAGVPPADVRIVDTAGDVGGTWYWNRYPGAQCDVESYVYMPLCEETGYVPTEKYARQPELMAHSQLIARKYGLYENACFGAQVTGMEWEEGAGRWTITTTRDDRFRARFVIMNFGTFTQAKLPKVPGVADFKGHIFHTSRWDYAYTGGSSAGGLDRLGDKRVGVIGTGATAVQIVPHLGAAARQLVVFQRTPSSIDVRNNRATTPEFAEEFLSKPGWQRHRMDNFMRMVQVPSPAPIKDLVQDGWTDIIRNLSINGMMLMREKQKRARETGVKLDMKELAREIGKLSTKADFQQMEKVRRRTDAVVKDRATADALKPWYAQFCKRPCFHDEYLSTFNRPNVSLVDTHGQGVDRVTPRGVVANGVEHVVDCIVMATGFETGYNAASMGPRKLGYDIVGRNGVALSAKWADGGVKTFESFSTAGFPNLFMQNAPQGTFTVNFVQQLDEGARHFAHVISRMRAEGYTKFDVKPEEEAAYVKRMHAQAPLTTGEPSPCTPGYYNNEGVQRPKGERMHDGFWSPPKFFAHMQKRRDDGTALAPFNLER